jgi:hypothetical protein
MTLVIKALYNNVATNTGKKRRLINETLDFPLLHLLTSFFSTILGWQFHI